MKLIFVNSKTKTDRAIGGLGGGGGGLLLAGIIEYLLVPSLRESKYWMLPVGFIIIGASLVIVAVFLSLRKRHKLSKP